MDNKDLDEMNQKRLLIRRPQQVTKSLSGVKTSVAQEIPVYLYKKPSQTPYLIHAAVPGAARIELV